MQRLEVSGAVRTIYESLGLKWLKIEKKRSIRGCQQEKSKSVLKLGLIL